MTKDELKTALTNSLANVRDPATGRDLLTSGLVQEIELDLPNVLVKLELKDAPASRRAAIEGEVRGALLELAEVDRVDVEFVAPERAAAPGGGAASGPRRLPMAGGASGSGPGGPGGGPGGPGGPGGGAVHGQGQAGRQPIPKVRNLIAVASGKGGVGKSTVCVNLALALRHLGHRVGLLDADIYGPSIPHMLGLNRRPEPTEDGKINPLTSYGIELMSLGFLVDDSTPVIWRGPMVQGVVKQFLHSVNWGELDYLMIDLPPGTGDAQLTLVQSVALTGVVVVTTPSDIALIDAAKGLKMFRSVDVPVFGIIENMSHFVCPHCDERSDIFSSQGGERMAKELSTDFLGEIPIDTRIRSGGDHGKPVVAVDPTSSASAPFITLAETVVKRCGHEVTEEKAKAKKGFFKGLLGKN